MNPWELRSRWAAGPHLELPSRSEGAPARGGIADHLGRKSTDLARPLGVLQDVGTITHDADAFRSKVAGTHFEQVCREDQPRSSRYLALRVIQ